MDSSVVLFTAGAVSLIAAVAGGRVKWGLLRTDRVSGRIVRALLAGLGVLFVGLGVWTTGVGRQEAATISHSEVLPADAGIAPVEPAPPSVSVTTSGDNAPAIVGSETGDIHIGDKQ